LNEVKYQPDDVVFNIG